MWYDAEIIDNENNIIDEDGGNGSDCDSGVNDNISDINTISDVEDSDQQQQQAPIDMEVINYIYNNQQQLEYHHQPHILHPIIEADDETASSIDSGADFSENKHEALDVEEVEDEDFGDDNDEIDIVDSIIADPTIRVAGIAKDWIDFDNKIEKCNISYKFEPFACGSKKNVFTNKLEYLLHVVIPKLYQHADSDIFAKLKPQRIHPNFQGPLERCLSLEVIEQRILHCYYSDYSQCLNDFEILFFFNTFPKEIYDFGHQDSIGVFFRKLLHRLPHEEIELPPPILSQYKSSLSTTCCCPTLTTTTVSSINCLRRKRKHSFSSTSTSMEYDDEATSKKRALIISTNDLLNRFKAFSPSSN